MKCFLKKIFINIKVSRQNDVAKTMSSYLLFFYFSIFTQNQMDNDSKLQLIDQFVCSQAFMYFTIYGSYLQILKKAELQLTKKFIRIDRSSLCGLLFFTLKKILTLIEIISSILHYHIDPYFIL